MKSGKIVDFNELEGIGWIEDDKTQERSFFHYNFIKPSPLKSNIKADLVVKFNQKMTDQGSEAYDIEIGQ